MKMRKTLTFIGNGNMALSMAKGLKEHYDIEVAGRNPERLDAFEEALGVSVAKHALEGFDISGKTVLLCVKPANVTTVGHQLKGKAAVLYSVLAGTPISTLLQHFDADAVVRAMPNLAATVGRSMTTLTGESAFMDEAAKLFGSIGPTRWLGSEKELDIATALAGSGPAYLSLIAEALADGAVREGLKRDDAMALMRGLFAGFGELIQHEHPALIKDGVMSPGGTTAAGYTALEDAGVRSGCIDAVSRAYKRATEL